MKANESIKQTNKFRARILTKISTYFWTRSSFLGIFDMPDINAEWIIPIIIFFISLKGFTRIKEKEKKKRGGYIWKKRY